MKNTMIRVEFMEGEQIRKIGDLLWDMLTASYADIGGLKAYRSKEHFLSIYSIISISFAKV